MLKILEVLDGKKTHLNPFISQLVTSMETNDAEVIFWSYKHALFGSYDAVHIHWPEHLYKGKTKSRSSVKLVLFMILLMTWRSRKMPIVWTVHNLFPHEKLTPLQRIADMMFRRSVSLAIYLNDYPDDAPGLRANVQKSVIKHGDYVDWMKEYQTKPRVDGRICLFGALRPYKGVESLISAAKDLPPTYSLSIVGKPITDEYGEQLRLLIDGHHRISFVPEFQKDSELVSVISGSSLCVLPYKNMYNSGAVFLSLSLNRPVLVPENASTVLLQKEFGTYWVRTYSDPLSARVIEKSLLLEPPLDEAPNFSSRMWPVLGKKYVLEIEKITIKR